jgi:hypothetical protein
MERRLKDKTLRSEEGAARFGSARLGIKRSLISCVPQMLLHGTVEFEIGFSWNNE